MAAMSDYIENNLIDHIFRTATFGKPAGIHIGLFTIAPTDAGGGTEVIGGSYARVAVTQADTEWDAPVAGNGQTANTNPISFPAPTADWGQVVAFGIFDAASAGNLLFHGALTTPKTVNNGDAAPNFPAGSLTLTFA